MADIHSLPLTSAGGGSGPAAALASALYEACKEGDLARAKLLLAAGAEPACRDEQGQTPLMLAAEQGDVVLVQALLGEPRIFSFHITFSCPPTSLLLCVANARPALT